MACALSLGLCLPHTQPFPKCFVVVLSIASHDLPSQIGLSAFVPQAGSMGIAPLQYKGRLTLSFSPAWWIQHGKEVFFHLGLGLEAVTLAQSDGISNTDSMTGMADQFSVHFKCVATPLDQCSLRHYQHGHFPCCSLWTLLRGSVKLTVCVCIRMFTCANLKHVTWVPRLSSWARERSGVLN